MNSMNFPQPDKKRVARDFGRAAPGYDRHAALQRQVADKLLTFLPLQTHRPLRRILDLGSGTGYCSRLLRELYPEAEIINLDIAEGMLVQARTVQAGNNREYYLCADAEALPFAENSFDLVVSSLTIQWCTDYHRLFSGLAHILRPGGLLLASTFGPKSLREVRLAWQEVDDRRHVNEFAGLARLRQILAASSFLNLQSREELILRPYESFRALGRELKGLGASSKHTGRRQGLGGRQRLQQLEAAFARGTDSRKGRLASYEIIYLRAER